MRRWYVFVGAVVVSFVLTVTSARADSKAKPSLPKPDPSQHTPLVRPRDGGSTDNDIYIVVANNDTATGFVAVEGWLHMDATASGARGTFVDNFGGAKKYPASTDSANNTTINTHLGKFVFDSTGAATSLPTKVGRGAYGGLSVHDHAFTTFGPYPFKYSPTFGYSPGLLGNIALTYDGNNFVVPYSKTLGSVSAITYLKGTKKVVAPISAPAYFAFIFFQATLNGKQLTFIQTSGDGSPSGFAQIVGTGANGGAGMWQITTP